MNDDLEQFDTVTATFHPQRTDDLTNGADQWIGWRGEWQAMWIIERGPYEGPWALSPWQSEQRPSFAWVPFCDLADVVIPARGA